MKWIVIIGAGVVVYYVVTHMGQLSTPGPAGHASVPEAKAAVNAFAGRRSASGL